MRIQKAQKICEKEEKNHNEKSKQKKSENGNYESVKQSFMRNEHIDMREVTIT